MTIEDKLEELGYKIETCHILRKRTYIMAKKWFEGGEIEQSINFTFKEGEKIIEGKVDYPGSFKTQEDIDNVQIAFNRVQADKKELEKYIRELENDERKV